MDSDDDSDDSYWGNYEDDGHGPCATAGHLKDSSDSDDGYWDNYGDDSNGPSSTFATEPILKESNSMAYAMCPLLVPRVHVLQYAKYVKAFQEYKFDNGTFTGEDACVDPELSSGTALQEENRIAPESIYLHAPKSPEELPSPAVVEISREVEDVTPDVDTGKDGSSSNDEEEEDTDYWGQYDEPVQEAEEELLVVRPMIKFRRWRSRDPPKRRPAPIFIDTKTSAYRLPGNDLHLPTCLPANDRVGRSPPRTKRKANSRGIIRLQQPSNNVLEDKNARVGSVRFASPLCSQVDMMSALLSPGLVPKSSSSLNGGPDAKAPPQLPPAHLVGCSPHRPRSTTK